MTPDNYHMTKNVIYCTTKIVSVPLSANVNRISISLCRIFSYTVFLKIVLNNVIFFFIIFTFFSFFKVVLNCTKNMNNYCVTLNFLQTFLTFLKLVLLSFLFYPIKQILFLFLIWIVFLVFLFLKLLKCFASVVFRQPMLDTKVLFAILTEDYALFLAYHCFGLIAAALSLLANAIESTRIHFFLLFAILVGVIFKLVVLAAACTSVVSAEVVFAYITLKTKILSLIANKAVMAHILVFHF